MCWLAPCVAATAISVCVNYCKKTKKQNGNFCIYKNMDCLQEVLLTMDATFSFLLLTFFRALYTIHAQMKWLTVNIEHSVVNKHSAYSAYCIFIYFKLVAWVTCRLCLWFVIILPVSTCPQNLSPHAAILLRQWNERKALPLFSKFLWYTY